VDVLIPRGLSEGSVGIVSIQQVSLIGVAVPG